MTPVTPEMKGYDFYLGEHAQDLDEVFHLSKEGSERELEQLHLR